MTFVCLNYFLSLFAFVLFLFVHFYVTMWFCGTFINHSKRNLSRLSFFFGNVICNVNHEFSRINLLCMELAYKIVLGLHNFIFLLSRFCIFILTFFWWDCHSKCHEKHLGLFGIHKPLMLLNLKIGNFREKFHFHVYFMFIIFVQLYLNVIFNHYHRNLKFIALNLFLLNSMSNPLVVWEET